MSDKDEHWHEAMDNDEDRFDDEDEGEFNEEDFFPGLDD